MPTYGHAHFISRAIRSVIDQALTRWELIIVDDGSPDDTALVVYPFLSDSRIRYVRLEQNVGLGAALNVGLVRARGDFIGYLPSDDVLYPGHISSLVELLAGANPPVMAVSGVRHHYNRSSSGRIEGEALQLVQVMHRPTSLRWTERSDLVTDDLNRLFWDRLAATGRVAASGEVTCEWVDHPQQLHKVLREPEGGINSYRSRFQVTEPIRFHSSVGSRIDEVALYRQFRQRPRSSPNKEGLKILLVGELAYNPERVLALEERGHSLFGLWMSNPYWYNSVGPQPFGHVTDLPRCGWQSALRDLRPDIIYALLNWQTVPFANEVLEASDGIPFVWHFKEGPFICLEKGTWPELTRLYSRSTGIVYCSPEMARWTSLAIPESCTRPSFILDGDLPKQEWFYNEPSTRISRHQPGIHTVVPGRPIGLHPGTVEELAAEDIHLHFYGDFTHGQWSDWISETRRLAPHHLHLHGHVGQSGWVQEFSKYDAGWLHYLPSDNGGDIRRATWDDLNYPARLSTLAAAGLPVIQYDNSGSAVAAQALTRDLGTGVFARSIPGLRSKLGDADQMERIRQNAWNSRRAFTFDFHADRLVEFFRQVISDSTVGTAA